MVEVSGDTVLVPVGLTEPKFGLIVIDCALVISHFSIVKPPLEIMAGLPSNIFIIGASGDFTTVGVAGAVCFILLVVEVNVLLDAVVFADTVLFSAELLGADEDAQPG